MAKPRSGSSRVSKSSATRASHHTRRSRRQPRTSSPTAVPGRSARGAGIGCAGQHGGVERRTPTRRARTGPARTTRGQRSRRGAAGPSTSPIPAPTVPGARNATRSSPARSTSATSQAETSASDDMPSEERAQRQDPEVAAHGPAGRSPPRTRGRRARPAPAGSRDPPRWRTPADEPAGREQHEEQRRPGCRSARGRGGSARSSPRGGR